MLKQKTLAALIFGCMVFVGANYALAAGSPPPIPTFVPDQPSIDTTETQTNDTGTVAGTSTASKTASTTSSGPGDIVLVVGLGVIAVLSLRKYSRQKKYSL